MSDKLVKMYDFSLWLVETITPWRRQRDHQGEAAVPMKFSFFVPVLMKLAGREC